jgi:hypothetical protein
VQVLKYYFYKYEPKIDEWDELYKITQTTESLIRLDWIYQGCSLKLEAELKAQVKTERGQRVANKLIRYAEPTNQSQLSEL